MKKINVLAAMLIAALLMRPLNRALAQTHAKSKGKLYVEAFDDGRVLTGTDIRFLNSITGNGNDSREAVILDKKFKAGQKITVTDAAMINKAKSDYRKNHKMEKAADGRAIDQNTYQSCFWYKYNDDRGAQYYVWYAD